MGYVTKEHLRVALNRLRGKHPMSVLVLPSMVHAGVKVESGSAPTTQYGAADELKVLEEYFKVPGAPLQNPYCAIWESDFAQAWRDSLYPGRSLQRMRTDCVKKGLGLVQIKVPGLAKHIWSLRPNCGPELQTYVGGSVSIVDLAVWYGRNQDVSTVSMLVDWFLNMFPLDQDALIGTVYDTSQASEYHQLALEAEAATQDDYAELLGVVPPAPRIEATLPVLVTEAEQYMTQGGFVLAAGLVERVISSWMQGSMVVLVGQPGTGKTKFAQLMSEYLMHAVDGLRTAWIAVRPGFDETDFIGFERLNGTMELRDFAQRVLQTNAPLAPHLVVLEEFNLAMVEEYMASILVATQDPERRVSLPDGSSTALPVDTFFLATCNSYLDEPETRLRASYPVKRRSVIITMPNVLAERYATKGNDAILQLAVEMIRQEHMRVDERVRQGLASSFDSARLKALSTIQTYNDLSPEVRTALVDVVATVLRSVEGRLFFTLGLLRDVALTVAYAERTSLAELMALGDAVADKIVHQLRGPVERADELASATTVLPNAAEIALLLDRMKSGPGSTLIPLL